MNENEKSVFATGPIQGALPSGALRRAAIIPPFDGVALVDYRDRIELSPLFSFREFVGMGRFQADKVAPRKNGEIHPFFAAAFGKEAIWVIVSWRRYEDGREQGLRTRYLDPKATEAEARNAFESEISFMNMPREELDALLGMFAATDDDRDYAETRMPNVQRAVEQKKIDNIDVHQARLKVMAGMQSNTVAMIHNADNATEPAERARFEREAVQAFFADMAHAWSDELLKDWQRTNPVGMEWLLEFAKVRKNPKLELNPVNYELALNWLRRKYDLLTAEELSEAVYKVTGQRVAPATLKKRRERLGLTTKRQPGPRPNSDQ